MRNTWRQCVGKMQFPSLQQVAYIRTTRPQFVNGMNCHDTININNSVSSRHALNLRKLITEGAVTLLSHAWKTDSSRKIKFSAVARTRGRPIRTQTTAVMTQQKSTWGKGKTSAVAGSYGKSIGQGKALNSTATENVWKPLGAETLLRKTPS